MNCGERIQKLRLDKKMTLERLAEEAGVSSQILAEWESGTSLPPTGKLLVLAAILGTSAEYLDKGTDPSKNREQPRRRKGGSAFFTAAIIVYFAGFAMNLFPHSVTVLGTPLFFYGTSLPAVLVLVCVVALLCLGVYSSVTTREKR